MTLVSPRLPEGGYFEICRQEIDDEPPEAVERIKEDFNLMSLSPEVLDVLEEMLQVFYGVATTTREVLACEKAAVQIGKANGAQS